MFIFHFPVHRLSFPTLFTRAYLCASHTHPHTLVITFHLNMFILFLCGATKRRISHFGVEWKPFRSIMTLATFTLTCHVSAYVCVCRSKMRSLFFYDKGVFNYSI